MERQYNGYIGALLVALLLCFTACEEELWNESDLERPLAQGEFVVDYAADGLDTRSIHAQVPKRFRISSLTYLLYDIQGNLLKRREIPDIDTSTVWPLKRETMTWAQREALKDTLTTQRMNRVVFVANIDPKKCGWKDANGLPVSPLQYPEDLNRAYLELPAQAFNDGNMFYLFMRDTLVKDMTGIDREHPLNCPVTLHRVVTRTDFFTEEFPEWEKIDDNTEENLPAETDTVYKYMAYYAQNLFAENLLPKDNQVTMAGSLLKEQDAFLDIIQGYFNKKSLENLEALDGKYKTLADNTKKLRDYIQAHPELLPAYLTEEARSAEIFPLLIEDCLRNQELRTLWKSTWRSGKWAELSYKDNNNGTNRFHLQKKKTDGTLAASAKIEVDTVKVMNDKVYQFDISYCGFSHIGFANPEKNILSAIQWYDQETDQQASNTLQTGGTLTTQQRGNEWYEIRYQPMQPLSYQCDPKGQAVAKSYTSVYDLEAGLPFEDALASDQMTEEDLTKVVSELKTAIKEEALPNFSTENKQKYWPTVDAATDSLKQVTLTIQYPDLSKKGALLFKEKWNIRKVQGGITK